MSQRRKSGQRSRQAAHGGDPALDALAREWCALEAGLPYWARVRMEGLDPGALPLRQAAWTAVGYLTKWAACSFQCPAQVEAHFSAHRRALRLLADCPAGSSGGEQQRGGGGFVSLGLVGDCMWMRDTWAGWASPEVRRLLEGLHAVVGNLETPLHVETPTDPKWVIQSYLPDMVTYSSPVTFLHAFRREAAQAQAPPLVGAFSVANNHSADMGPNGAQSTLAALDAEGMVHCGMRRSGESRAWCMFERTAGALHAVSQGGSSKKRTPQRSGGIARAVSPGRRKAAATAPAGAADTLRVGVYAATWGVNFPDRAEECAAAGVTIQTVPGLTAASPSGEGVDVSEACAALRDMAAAGCGLRIVSIHWGHEFEGYPTVCQMRVARILVAAGADIVLGAHSHTQQPAEVLLVNGHVGDTGEEQAALKHVPECCRLAGVEGPPRKALVLYGMGNFCSTMFNEICRVGLLMTLQLTAPPPPLAGSPAAPWAWRLPAWHWLYNDAAVLRGATWAPRTRRRLVHVASDGAGTLSAGGGTDSAAHTLAPRKRKLVDFMRCHVLGSPGLDGAGAGGGAPEQLVPPPMGL